MTDIVSIDDIADTLGVTFTAADEALADRLRKAVEAAVRRFVRWDITQASKTVFLPDRSSTGRYLALPTPYVSAVASVYEDWSSVGGQSTGVFPASSLLTAGEDYWVEYETLSVFSKEGTIIRYHQDWCPYLRSVKVTYTSGFTADQLAGDYIDIADAIIGETVERFKQAKSRQGVSGDIGPVISEKLKDYSATYFNNLERATVRKDGQLPASGLLPETELRLMPYYNFYDHF